MNTFFKVSGASLSLVLLAACGDDHHHAHEEHGHGLFISQANNSTLSFLEEGQLESLHDSAVANGAELLLASNGEAAAIITSGQVQFISAHEEEEAAQAEAEHDLPELSVTDVTGANIQVVNTNGHFSVLANGATQLVPFETLGEATPHADALDLGITETAPALLLEEGETELVTLAFDGTNAVVYEGIEPSADTTPCVAVNSTAQSAEFAVVSCDAASFSVKLEEGVTEHTIDIDTSFTISTAVEWKAAADVFVGLGADDRFYVLEEDTVTESLALEIDFAAPDTEICDWGVDSAAADILVLTANELIVFAHDGTNHSVTLDQSTQATCADADLRMATAAQAVAVIDNQAQYLYEIDKEEGALIYHIHGRENLSVNDVESVLMFHEAGVSDSHAH